MADMIPFPRVCGTPVSHDPQKIANMAGASAELTEDRGCSAYLNRPCRSPAELERMLAGREAREVLANHIGVIDSMTPDQRAAIAGHDGPETVGRADTTAAREGV